MGRFSELIDTLENDELDSDWENAIEESRHSRVTALLEEAYVCYEAGANRSSVVMLWAAGAEELKELLLLYDMPQLRGAKHLSDDISSRSDLHDEGDSQLLRAAENLGLLGPKDLTILETVNQFRNGCAHGDDIEVDKKHVAFVFYNVRDRIFAKFSRAGVNAEIILNLIQQGNLPQDYLDTVGDFRESEQYQLLDELYMARKDLPLKRMSRRDSYMIRESKYSRADKRQRDAVDDAISQIRGQIDYGIRCRVRDKALQQRHGNESILGFLITHCMDVMGAETANTVIEEFLEDRREGDWEDDNDVAVNLAQAEEFPELDADIVKRIWGFARTNTPNQLDQTIQHYHAVISTLQEACQQEIASAIAERLDRADELFEMWGTDVEDEPDRAIQESHFRYIKRYFDCFPHRIQEDILSALEDSCVSELDEVEEFLRSAR